MAFAVAFLSNAANPAAAGPPDEPAKRAEKRRPGAAAPYVRTN
jgi:hypothetical protein